MVLLRIISDLDFQFFRTFGTLVKTFGNLQKLQQNTLKTKNNSKNELRMDLVQESIYEEAQRYFLLKVLNMRQIILIISFCGPKASYQLPRFFQLNTFFYQNDCH